MKILFVASYNKGYYAPFILEQAEALREKGCVVDFYGVSGKGIRGYVASYPGLKRKIALFRPDIIHAHYGLSGLLANMQRRVPVVTTYHGSDINEKSVLLFSKIAMSLSKHNIFVSQRNVEIAKPHGKYSLIPCGINVPVVLQKEEAREIMGLATEGKYVLFAGAFDNYVKNYPLAKAAIDLVPGACILELKGYSRTEVSNLMCAVDAILMTSFTEGSPQVIKEAMSCGCPVVSVDVGDVSCLVSGVDGCYIAERDPISVSRALMAAFKIHRTFGQKKILEMGLVNSAVALEILKIYHKICND